MSSWSAAAIGIVIVILCVLIWRALRESRRLRGRLEAAALELENLQLAFSRFAPDHVIERIIAEGVADFGEKKEVSVLFADLVGFTTLSEARGRMRTPTRRVRTQRLFPSCASLTMTTRECENPTSTKSSTL